MFDFVTKHVVVVSALILGIASVVTMLFLAAYLSVFDWRLIWLIEYSDLTKFFLVGTALVASLLFVFNSFGAQIDLFLEPATKTRKRTIIFFACLFLFIYGLGVTIDIYKSWPALSKMPNANAFRFLATAAVFAFIYVAAHSYKSWFELEWASIVRGAAMLGLALTVVAFAFGYHVKEREEGTRTIVTKTKTYADTRLILMLSHHLAFLDSNNVVVVPTSELQEMTLVPKQ